MAGAASGAGPGSPAPLLVFIHGGPLSSWTDWSWRWNPHLLAARGYAVLLPDPALSTGYGQAFIDRGWGRWGGQPYTDLMAAVDAAVARPDIDETRTAAMGGSFGGYMANWMAGHTDRFRCIVTHASLWALDQFHGTTDFGPVVGAGVRRPRAGRGPATRPTRPHRHAAAIRTPMLVIHGERDHRVPIGEALRLWTDLSLGGVRGQVPLLPRREPLDPQATERPRLVRDGVRLPRPPRPRQGVDQTRAALTRWCPGAGLGAAQRCRHDSTGSPRPSIHCNRPMDGGCGCDGCWSRWPCC